MTTPDRPTIAIVETHPALPGLLPAAAWEALTKAAVVHVVDVESHPSAGILYFAGMDLAAIEPLPLARGELDLSLPGGPDERRIAKSLIATARRDGFVAFLLHPEDRLTARIVATEAARVDVDVEFVFFLPSPGGAEVVRLADVMRRLRHPQDGCPWDLEQDHATLRPYLLEEVYELLEAIDAEDDEAIVEELGDVLMQIAFHAQVADDRGAFDLDDVARGIVDKLTRRHPHVFADGDASTSDEVQQRWDELKSEEKQRTGPFDGIPSAQPALALAQASQRRGLKAGGDLELVDAHAALDALASAEADVEARLGDALAAVVALAREAGVDAEDALRRHTLALQHRIVADGT